ncbi:MAG: SIMPL domain-containing protein [Gammaproteobacteria bacterium]|uniref:SIMPL domain-containing protein n=1 Tax=Limnobacter sp. TaxID=2003368 RepID=UPI001D3F4854|nr:SIMPL domain-containing protein [Limnobacter sp.]MBU0783774.1 SIMPL domain-containing protein [Gammaproteobacteria bacterium]MBU0847808.1 SIMPL domain-containing protein [Gammaproteobacteria bacterium]MBU1267058.1 SIMPL domain-containing protein [Gammaproteobacteria bacterium]MBU1527952.1 SIMPL domain-containing protein [Gammaproteobacteria bacterium]MBU1778763.1 SIMPL domain-containing protein [Gammaproteobacteria bacterium]
MKISNALRIALFGTTLGLLAPTVAHADLCEKTPAVNLNAVSSEDVDNDMVRLNWQVQIQAGTANEAMTAINTVLEKSIRGLSGNTSISKLRNNIQTYPQYGKDRSIQTWQGVGTLTFEMPVQALKNQKNLNVAEGLTLNNLEYFPSDARIEQSREKLLQSAMKEFQNKASVAAKGFGKTGYTIGEVSINDENQGSPGYPRMYAASADMMAKGVEVTPAAGSSRLSVSVNGRVCLKP